MKSRTSPQLQDDIILNLIRGFPDFLSFDKEALTFLISHQLADNTLLGISNIVSILKAKNKKFKVHLELWADPECNEWEEVFIVVKFPRDTRENLHQLENYVLNNINFDTIFVEGLNVSFEREAEESNSTGSQLP